MRLVLLIFLLPFVALAQSNQDRPVGVNLTDVSPFGTLWYYTNVLKQSTGWLVYNLEDETDPVNLSAELTTAIAETFDERGYPLQVPFISDNNDLANKQLGVSCLVLNAQPEPYFYPSGNYLLIFEGDGSIAVQGDLDAGYLEFNTGGAHDIQITNPTSTGLQLLILSSNPNDPIRNVQLIMPEYRENHGAIRFQQAFLELASLFEVLRFMKPLKSENNTITNFEDRSVPNDFAFFLDLENTILPGMPYEDVIEISNITSTNPWITIPYLATDDYVRKVAELFNVGLNNELQVYIEYSNETWNPAYPETRAYMLEMGARLATSPIPEVAEFEAIHRYHALRSLEIFKIFEDQFSNDNQLVRVHGSQSDPFTADLVAEAYALESVNPEGRMPDGVAIASYIGVTFFDDLRAQNLNICDHTAQDLLDSITMRTSRELEEMVTRYTELFGDTDIEIMAYEGGQHVTELNFQPMEPCAAQLVRDMNQLAGMDDFFCSLLDEWFENYQGGTFNVFNLAEGPDDFGSFGIVESQWQETSMSPKWSGIFDCVEVLSIEETTSKNTVYPTRSGSNIYISTEENMRYAIYDLKGTLIDAGMSLATEVKTVDVIGWKPGFYIVLLKSNQGTQTIKLLID